MFPCWPPSPLLSLRNCSFLLVWLVLLIALLLPFHNIAFQLSPPNCSRLGAYVAFQWVRLVH